MSKHNESNTQSFPDNRSKLRKVVSAVAMSVWLPILFVVTVFKEREHLFGMISGAWEDYCQRNWSEEQKDAWYAEQKRKLGIGEHGENLL